MADTSTAHLKQELRKKLESMKKDYARTLRNVEKSEKAKRVRSHVQRKLAEQAHHSTTSPSCTQTHTRTNSEGSSESKIETSSDVKSQVLFQEETTRGDRDEGGGSNSVTAVRRVPKKRRSVSFIIPKEVQSMRNHDEVETEVTNSCQQSKMEKISLASGHNLSPKTTVEKAALFPVPSREKITKDDFQTKTISTGDGKSSRNRPKERVVVVVSESQFADSLEASLDDSSNAPEIAYTTAALSDDHAHVKVANENQNNTLPYSNLDQDSSKNFTDFGLHQRPCSSSVSSLPNAAALSNLNNKNSKKIKPVKQKMLQRPPQIHIKDQLKEEQVELAKVAKKRSRKRRQLTASDISMKEVAQSQSTEQGSHTWIEGLMYPVEYYVRRTRSMTSSQSSQSQSCMDKNDSQRYTDSQLKMTRRDTLTTPSRSKDVSTPRVTTLTSAGRNQMEATDSILESDSDTLRSQLSESLLKTPSAVPHECVDKANHDSDTIKLSRSTKNRRLQRRRGIGFGKKSPMISTSKNDFGAKLDTLAVPGEDSACSETSTKDIKSNSDIALSIPDIESVDSLSSQTVSDLRTGSTPNVPTPKLTSGSLALRNPRLPQMDFALPDEDFGILKLAKLQSSCVADIPTLNYSPKGEKAPPPEGNGEKQVIPLSPKMEEDNLIDSLKSYKAETNKASVPSVHRRNCYNYKAGSTPPLTNGPYQSDKCVTENISTKMNAACVEAAIIKQTRISQEKYTTSTEQRTLLDLGPTNRSGETQTAGHLNKDSPGKSVLHSQFSPTQFSDNSSSAFPVAGCTPGFSPSCTPGVIDGVMLTKDMLLSPQDTLIESGLERCKDEDGNRDFVCTDKKEATVFNTLETKPNQPYCSRTDIKVSSQPSVTSCQPVKPNPSAQSNSQQHTLFVFPPSYGATSGKAASSVSERPSESLPHKNSTRVQSTMVTTMTSSDGSTTPPNFINGVASGDLRGNIDQKSPFAGVATGSPFGRAEEPQAMSQCEVKIPSEDDDDEKKADSRHKLVLIGCLQHDIPWELSPTVRDVAGGWMNVNGNDVSVLIIVYQHTLVIWRYNTDTEEWNMVQSWVIPQDEELICVKCMPCSRLNTVSIVVAGIFASCSVRRLTYDTVTKETQQLDVNLPRSWEDSVPHLLCAANEQDFVVAVKDNKNKSGVFWVHACLESSDVQTVRLSTGADTELTSLLLVEGTERIIMATTSHNNILLWNLKTGDLMKDVLMKPVLSGSLVSCMKATAESGLLFLVLVFKAVQYRKSVGATVVINPLTDKMITLVEYEPSSEHADASLVDSVIHNNSLLVELSDGSLHQWDIFSGNLMNYSASHSTSYSLRSAHFGKSQVVLLGTDQCQQVYDALFMNTSNGVDI